MQSFGLSIRCHNHYLNYLSLQMTDRQTHWIVVLDCYNLRLYHLSSPKGISNPGFSMSKHVIRIYLLSCVNFLQ